MNGISERREAHPPWFILANEIISASKKSCQRQCIIAIWPAYKSDPPPVSFNEHCVTLKTTYVLWVVLMWYCDSLCCFRGTVRLPMSLVHWEALCTSCVYTRHALLMHELLNFIVPSSSSPNLTFCVSTHSSLSLSLSHSVICSAHSSYIAPILQIERSSLPDLFMYAQFLFNSFRQK